MSEMNYLKGLPIHQFEESMTITECSFETLAMANREWEAIEESVDDTGLSLFEAELLGLDEAQSGGFVDKVKELGKKIIEFLKKIASYIMGFISKWLTALMQLVKKDAFKAKDKARIQRGAEKLTKDNKEVKLYGLLVDKHDTPNYQALIDLAKGDKLGKLKDFEAMSDEDIASIASVGEVTAAGWRGMLAGVSGAVEAQNFRKKIRFYMTGHEDVAEYSFNAAELPKAAEIARNTIVKGAEKQKKAAKKGYDDCSKVINKYISDIANLTKKAKDIKDDNKKDTALRALKATGALYNGASKIIQQANSEALNVLSADYRMNATLLMKCYIAGGSDEKAKKEAKKEKEQNTNESVESIFGLDLI